MKNYSKLIISSVALVAGLSAPTANADWLDNYTITSTTGITTSNLDYRRTAATDNRKTSLSSLSLSMGIAGKKWFGRFNVDYPLAPGYYLGGSGVLAMKRTDYSTTIGYPLSPRVSVFGGYLYTLIDLSSSGGFLETQVDSGPFIGASLEMYRGKKSTVSANIAYAYMYGTANRTSAPSTVIFDVNGPSAGFSYGINWSGQIGRSDRIYLIGYKIQDFRFEGTGSGGPQTIDKKYSVFTLSIIL